MGMNVSKLLFTVNLPVTATHLRKALEAAGLPLNNETMFRARHEMIYLLNREMDRLLAQVAENVKNAKEA